MNQEEKAELFSSLNWSPQEFLQYFYRAMFDDQNFSKELKIVATHVFYENPHDTKTYSKQFRLDYIGR